MTTLKLKSYNYAVGLFGSSIPINMLKTYAAIYYVGSLAKKSCLQPVYLIVPVYRQWPSG
jgi:hypothetical protein